MSAAVMETDTGRDAGMGGRYLERAIERLTGQLAQRRDRAEVVGISRPKESRACEHGRLK